MSITLGIDIGTSGTKTLAIDERGTILASASAEYPCDHPRPGWSEQHPELWWDATVETIGQVLAVGHVPRRATSPGIGLSGQMHGSVFLDEEGQVIRPALLWNDQRTAAECREIEEKAGGREALIRMVGQPGADRLHGAEAALGPQATSRGTGNGSGRSCCRRITSATG